MSLKRRILNIFAAVVMVFGVVPIPFFNNSVNVHADGPELDVPGHSKRLIDNEDGTYTIALNVTGSRESSETTSASKANVILVVDTSNSMNSSSGETSASGQSISRITAEKDALTKNDGIVDKLLTQNVPGDSVKSDIIEVAVVNFGTEGHIAQTWTTNGTTLKSTINGLTTSTGTNWEGALQIAKTLADAKKQAQPDEDNYIIFLTDGEPTTDETRAQNRRHNVNMNYAEEWGYASDDARAIVAAGYTFYGLFTWGSSNNSTGYNQPPSAFLKSLVQYAYTGTGAYNSSLSSDYAEYYTDASSTTALIDALNQIVHDITTGVGYTNVELEDGVTAMTASSVKATASGAVTGLKYYRSGGPYSITANNGLGEEWTDAPEATINAGGEVDWNLGDLVLENGVTYTVTFVVWPKQSSLDLVADLNNGIVSYDSLTTSQKSQIKHVGDEYALKTNTDFPTLTYSTITTTTVDGVPTSVTSDPTTVNITNPDPVNLSEAKLVLEKKWEDSLDPTQREEIGGEVTLNLLMDGEPYEIKIGDALTDEILLTETNDWKINPGISVAPGLMVAEDSIAYDPNAPQVTYDGTTYAILEAGHEYVFEEKDINSHFELTSYIHHPMKIGNEVMDVFFTYDDEGNIAGIDRIESLDTLSATNTIKGGINIEKIVNDTTDGNFNPKTETFDIEVYLSDEEGNALPEKITADGTRYAYDYRIYYGENNPCYETRCEGVSDSDFEKHRSGHIYGTGTFFIETIYVGDVIRVVNIEDEAIYLVKEAPKTTYADGESDYTLEGIDYKYREGDKTALKDYDDEEKVVLNGETYYPMKGNTAAEVTVKNKYEPVETSVNFEKQWLGADNIALPESVTIRLYKNGEATSETKTITAEDDWKGSFTGLNKYENAVEITYTIKEDAIAETEAIEDSSDFFVFDDSNKTASGDSAVVGKWTPTLVGFVVRNTWTPASDAVNGASGLKLKKIDSKTKLPLADVEFTIIRGENVFTRTTDENGVISFSDLADGEYTVKEASAPEGYITLNSESTIAISHTDTLTSVDVLGLINTYTRAYSYNISTGSGYSYNSPSLTLTVENTPIEYIDITAAKVWDDDDNRDGLRKNYDGFYVAVKNNSGKYVAYEKLVLENKDNYTFAGLPERNADGEIITYMVVEASSCSGEGDAIECTQFDGDDSYSVQISNNVITNKHTPEPIPDPCADGEGCGGDTPIVPPITPETGVFTGSKGEVVVSGVTNWIGVVTVVFLVGISALMFEVSKELNRVKIDKKA